MNEFSVVLYVAPHIQNMYTLTFRMSHVRTFYFNILLGVFLRFSAQLIYWSLHSIIMYITFLSTSTLHRVFILQFVDVNVMVIIVI